MALNNPLKLDSIDRKILLELETNARQSNAAIARKAKVSEESVKYRISRLVKSGVITKFFVTPNFNRLGLTTFRLYLQFQHTTPEDEQEVIDYICNEMPCQWLGVCDGRWDVIARINAKDHFEFNNLLKEFFEKYGDFVRQQNVAVQLMHTWWPSIYSLAKESKKKRSIHVIPKQPETVKFDDVDLRILSILVENSRAPSVEIAKKIGKTPDIVAYRIKKLVKDSVITAFKSYLNRDLLGYQHNHVFLRFYQQPEKITQLFQFLSSFESVFFISSVVGAWDAEIGIDAKNSVEYHELFGEIKKQFGDAIRDYESLIVYKEYAPNPFKKML
ncbi:Lrp/AsnC family transcriptional regulator [Candidatus Micrarchaeota archaeon]|nr:Lrp/AsnC family transcriptional regulator [Candidatus Micrarchaeota archaeon]